jgi:hypothetical protein
LAAGTEFAIKAAREEFHQTGDGPIRGFAGRVALAQEDPRRKD